MKYEIKNRWTGAIIYQDEAEYFRALVMAAVKSRADLSSADLSGADLSGADLSGADLSRADLSSADLSGADLSNANLYGFFSFGPGGSRTAYTWARWEDDGYMVHCGCAHLSLKDFEKAVKEEHGNTYFGKWYAANIATMKLIAKESKKDWLEYKAKKAEKVEAKP